MVKTDTDAKLFLVKKYVTPPVAAPATRLLAINPMISP